MTEATTTAVAAATTAAVAGHTLTIGTVVMMNRATNWHS